MAGLNYKTQTAFTLLEIIIAMAIASLIGIAALAMLDRATLSHKNIQEQGDRYNQIERAFLFISSDIQQLAPRKFRDEFGDLKDNLTSFESGGSTQLSFTRLGRRNPAGLPRSNLEKLSYLVEDNLLKRVSYAYPDGMSLDLGNSRDLLSGVESLKVEFYDGEEWTDFWPVEQQEFNQAEKQSTPMPVAIKLLLQLNDLGLVERLYVISDRLKKEDA